MRVKRSRIEHTWLESMPVKRELALSRLLGDILELAVADDEIGGLRGGQTRETARGILARRNVQVRSPGGFLEGALAGALDEDQSVLEARTRLEQEISGELETVVLDLEHGRLDLIQGLDRYDEALPREYWPEALIMLDDNDDEHAPGLISQVGGVDPPGRLGVMRGSVPPEGAFLQALDAEDQVIALADPASKVRLIEPVAAVGQMADVRGLVGLPEWVQESYGDDVTLAIIDTGLDRAHPDLSRVSPDDYSNFTPGAGDRDVMGHGSHCAGIAAGSGHASNGRYRGIAPRCRLVAAKVFADDGYASTDGILSALEWAVYERGAEVVSLSLGIASTPDGQDLLSLACDRLAQSGVLVCIAAGNQGPGLETITIPGDCAHGVTVGAVDKNLALASFSSRGSRNSTSAIYGKPNCVAPGVFIVASRSDDCDYEWHQGDRAYAALSGTSMACPVVAGCLTLLKSAAKRRPGGAPPAEELRDLLYRHCTPVHNPYGAPYDNRFEVGAGLVNIGSALEEVGVLADVAHARGELEVQASLEPDVPVWAAQSRKQYADTVEPRATTLARAGRASRSLRGAPSTEKEYCRNCGYPLSAPGACPECGDTHRVPRPL